MHLLIISYSKDIYASEFKRNSCQVRVKRGEVTVLGRADMTASLLNMHTLLSMHINVFPRLQPRKPHVTSFKLCTVSFFTVKYSTGPVGKSFSKHILMQPLDNIN